MEKFTLEIKEFFNEKLELYRQLTRVLKKERDSIIKMDIGALWKSSEEKKKIALKIESLKKNIVKCLKEKFKGEYVDIKSVSLSYLIRTFPATKETKTDLRQIKLAIENEKNELTRLALENKTFVQEYLSVIDDIMSVVVDNSRRSQYDLSGAMSGTKNTNVLIHAQV